jgi:hypothetical protein
MPFARIFTYASKVFRMCGPTGRAKDRQCICPSKPSAAWCRSPILPQAARFPLAFKRRRSVVSPHRCAGMGRVIGLCRPSSGRGLARARQTTKSDGPSHYFFRNLFAPRWYG